MAVRTHPLCSSSAKRKFRYLQPETENSDEGNQDQPGACEGPNTGAEKQARRIENAVMSTAPPERQKSRIQTPRACLFCKRSHMVCSIQRPCPRCVKRGIADLCISNEENQASSATLSSTGQQLYSQVSVTASRNRSESAPTERETLSSDTHSFDGLMERNGSEVSAHSDHASWNDVTTNNNTRRQAGATSSSAPAEQSTIVPDEYLQMGLQHAMQSTDSPATAMNQFLTRSAERQTSVAGRHDVFSNASQQHPHTSPTWPTIPTPSNFPPIAWPTPPPTTQSTTAILEQSPPDRAQQDQPPRHLIKRPFNHLLIPSAPHEYEMDNPLLRPYNYSYSFRRVRRWIRSPYSLWSTQSIDRVDVAIGTMQSVWDHSAENLSDLELVHQEKVFLDIVEYYKKHVLDAVAIPMCLLRRVGEIYAANEAFGELMGIDSSLFTNGRICLYQLCEEHLSVQLFEAVGNYITGTIEVKNIRATGELYCAIDALATVSNASNSAPCAQQQIGSIREGKVLVTFDIVQDHHGPILIVAHVVPLQPEFPLAKKV